MATTREREEVSYDRDIKALPRMRYSDFLKALSDALRIHLKTLHRALVKTETDLTAYQSLTTVRQMKDDFQGYLLENAAGQFSVGYQKVSSVVHPTAFTDRAGNVLAETPAADVGKMYAPEAVAPNYFLDALYYDSELERENMENEIQDVIVFTKIPRNSIKIPVAGGETYSPDFAYVVKRKDGGQRLHFVVETKNYAGESGMREAEKAKIRHAQALFGGEVSIQFRTQFSNDRIKTLIEEIMGGKAP